MAIKANPLEECVITITLKRKYPARGRALVAEMKIREFELFNSSVPIQERYEQIRNEMSREIDKAEIRFQKEGK